MSSTNPDSVDARSLGAKFWMALLGVALACGLGALLVFVFFGFIWAAWGLIGALIVFVALALGASWVTDRRARRRWS
jgi:Kef-type K+ transport system membrane component KefB